MSRDVRNLMERAVRSVEDLYANMHGKRCSTDFARRTVMAVLEELKQPSRNMVEIGAKRFPTFSPDFQGRAVPESARNGWAIGTFQAMIDEASQ